MKQKSNPISREKFIDKLRSVANDLGVARLGEKEFIARSGLTRFARIQHFDTWTDACHAAGLDRALRISERPAPKKHTDEDCINEVRRVSHILGTASPSRTRFDQHSLINASTLRRRFGDWQTVLAAAGLSPILKKQLTSDDCVREIQRVASLLHQKHLTRQEFRKHADPEYIRAIRVLGTWHDALSAAGLTPSPEFKAEIPLEKLASDFLQASLEIGKIPTLVQVTRRSDHADHTFAGKHGGYPAFKRLAIQHLLSSNARIPPAIREMFLSELARLPSTDSTTNDDLAEVKTKVQINQSRIISLIASSVGDWHPSSFRNELEYSNALAKHLRTVLPDDVQVDREYRHEGTTCDIRVAYKVDDEVFLEIKWQLRKKAECDRLIGQVEGLKPRKNNIIVVLIGDTNQSLLGRLKAHFNNYLTDQPIGEEKLMIVCVS